MNGADVFVPTSTLFRYRSTLLTPNLSEAETTTSKVPETIPWSNGLVMLTAGAIVSGSPFSTSTVISGDVPTLPLASYALLCRLYWPFSSGVVSQLKVNGVDVFVPTSTLFRYISTLLTPKLSEAKTTTSRVPETVEASKGEVTDVVGWMVSTGSDTDSLPDLCISCRNMGQSFAAFVLVSGSSHMYATRSPSSLENLPWTTVSSILPLLSRSEKTAGLKKTAPVEKTRSQ